MGEHADVLGYIIAGLASILGWFINNKLNKTDETQKAILEIITVNRDKAEELLKEQKSVLDDDIEDLKKRTRELETNYNSKFANVRQDISNLKEDNIMRWGDLRLEHAKEFTEIKAMLKQLACVKNEENK